MRAPCFSIVVPVYNGATFLGDALGSISRQTERDWECLIVDDGSVDQSRRIAEAWAAGHAGRVTVLTHERNRNRGVATSRNLAIEHARGRWLAFLDQDDVWRPGKLRAQREFAARHRAMTAIACLPALVSSGAPVPLIDFWLDSMRRLARARRGRLTFGDFVSGSPFCLSAVIAKRTAVRSAGGFDAGLRCTSDWLLWAKLASRGQTGIVPQTLLTYRLHDRNEMRSLLDAPYGLLRAAADTRTRLAAWLAVDRALPAAEAMSIVNGLIAPR